MPATGLKMKINRKSPWVGSFGFRTAFSFVLLFAAVSGISAFFTNRELERQNLERVRENLFTQTGLLLLIFTPETVLSSPPEKIQSMAEAAGNANSLRVTVVDALGRVLGDSRVKPTAAEERETVPLRPEIREALLGRKVSTVALSRVLREDALYAAVPVLQDGRPVGALRLSVPVRQVAQISGRQRRFINAVSAAGAFTFILLSVWLGRRLSRRVLQMSFAAARYARGDLDEKVFVDGHDEIQRLGDSLNKMAAALKGRGGEFEAEKVKLSAILNSMDEGVIAVDALCQVMFVNPSAAKIFDTSREAAAGKSLVALTRKPQLDELMHKAVSSGSSLEQEIEILQPAGARFLHAYAVGFSRAAGGVAGILVLSDMTRVRKLENLRREFVANVSHELKTPLTSIRGFIETLLGGALEDPKTCERFLRLMEDDARRLERLIQDLLEISRLEDKQISLKLQSLDLAEEAAYALERLQLQLKDKGLQAENLLAGAGLPRVSADRDRIRQVFLNLLDNAIKFNRPGGSIQIEGSFEGGRVRVSVTDSGVGIPEHARQRVFERFYRVDKARSREVGGTGLGLSIVKHIVEVHGGQVGCESEFGEGAVFFFSLPLSPPQSDFRS